MHNGETMIDPAHITNFDRSEEELQEFLLFTVMVHGKKASIQAVKLHCFLEYLSHFTGHSKPFEMVNIAQNMEDDETGETVLFQALKKFGLGQYNRLCQSIEDLVKLPDLRTVTVEQLENCFAVGPKSARFFLVHSRTNQEFAILDTHILKWLRMNGINAPKNTPQGKWYKHFEEIFLTLVKKAGKSVAEFDLNIWKMYATT